MFRTSFEVEIQYANSSDHITQSSLPRLGDVRKCNQLINFLRKRSISQALIDLCS